MREVSSHSNIQEEEHESVVDEQFLRSEEFSGEVREEAREVVYAGVLASRELEHETLEAQSYHERRELVTHTRVSQPQADQFLARVTPIGVTGKEFLVHLGESLTQLASYHLRRYNEEKIYLKPQEVHESIERFTLDKSRQLKETVTKILAQATDAGLLIHQESYGYYPYPEQISNFYVFNQDDTAISLLGGENLHSQEVLVDKEKVLELLSDEALVRNPDHPLKNDLTPKEFFSYFIELRTAKEAYDNKAFYKNNEVKYQQRYVCELFDSLLADGIASGALIERKKNDRVSFVLSPSAKSLL